MYLQYIRPINLNSDVVLKPDKVPKFNLLNYLDFEYMSPVDEAIQKVHFIILNV